MEKVHIAIKHADIEVLVEEFSKARQAGHQEVLEIQSEIEKHLDDIADLHRLPHAESFKQLVEMYDRRRYYDMLRAGQVDKVIELVKKAKGTRSAKLVASAAFESHDYLPSIKEGVPLLIALAKKLESSESLTLYIASYPRSNAIVGQSHVQTKLLIEITDRLAEEKDGSLVDLFEEALEPIADFSLRGYVQNRGNKRW